MNVRVRTTKPAPVLEGVTIELTADEARELDSFLRTPGDAYLYAARANHPVIYAIANALKPLDAVKS